MSLKLFRSTGYSSILFPGEMRAAMHPGWVITATSAWVGIACNVPLWRLLLAGESAGLLRAAVLGVVAAAGCAFVLSLLGWRKTLKPAATLILLMAALTASAIWSQALPLDPALLEKRLPGLLLPSWASFLSWQVPTLLVVLGLGPIVWVWSARVSRLSGPAQLRVNMMGMFMGAALVAGSAVLLAAG